MRDNSFFRVTIRSDQDSIWVREEIFVGTLTEFRERFGSKRLNPLTPFKRHNRVYTYHITRYIDGHWHSCSDPRND